MRAAAGMTAGHELAEWRRSPFCIMAIYEFEGMIPVVHETAFVHPQAAVTGNVVL